MRVPSEDQKGRKQSVSDRVTWVESEERGLRVNNCIVPPDSAAYTIRRPFGDQAGNISISESEASGENV
jgi:hypothetical protein